MKRLYTAVVTANGGREGYVQSPDELVNFEMRFPKAMGGTDDNHLNPELLFAAGYASCFDSVLNRVIRMEKLKVIDTFVTAHVSIGKIDEMRYGLSVELEIEIPGVDQVIAEEIAQEAHSICPYSNAIKGNIEVKLIVNQEDAVRIS